MPDTGSIVVHIQGAVVADQKPWLVCLPLTPSNALQAALERQDMSCTYLAHHELESLLFIHV